MRSLFKAGAAYCGILVKLSPQTVQGDLATGLSIYAMNVYELLEKYAWEGVNAYHFQFHQKTVASGKGIYLGSEWRQLDSELITSNHFAHPTPRATWNQAHRLVAGPIWRTSELAIREIVPSQGGYNPVAYVHDFCANTGTPPLTPQTGRNWDYRECWSTLCHYLHACITCGSSHRAPQSFSGNAALPSQPHNGSTRR